MTAETEQVVTRRDPYSALRYANFRLLIAGRLPAQIGEMMVSVGIGWELYERTRDAFALGLVGLVQMIPLLLLGLVGGYVADRYDRKRVVLVSQSVLILCSLGLAYLSVTNGSLFLIYAILAIIGAARAFNNPAEGALTPQTVPASEFFNAATWSTSVWQISAIVGPTLGGLIIGVMHSATAVYVINAVAGSLLVIAVLLLRTRQAERAPTTETPIQSVREGWRFLRRSPEILASITLDMFAVLLGGTSFLLPVFARDILFVDATGLGILRTAPSVGALLTAFVITRIPPFRKAGPTLLLCVAGFGVATVIFGLSRTFWLSVLLLALMGALDYVSVVIRHTLVLTRTPDAMRGRVNSVNHIFIGASNELGGFESGVAASLLGAVGAVVFGGVGTLVVVGLVAWLSPELRTLGKLEGE